MRSEEFAGPGVSNLTLTPGAPENRVCLFAPQMGGLSRRTAFVCDHRDPYRVWSADDVYAFQFVTVVPVMLEADTEEHGPVAFEFPSGDFNPSKLYVVRGKVYRYNEVVDLYGTDHQIVRSMDSRNIERVHVFGSMVTPFDINDHVHLKDYTRRMPIPNTPE